MVCIDELLVQLKISNNMDYCSDLANIQSIFNYANEYIKPLSKIRFRGGECGSCEMVTVSMNLVVILKFIDQLKYIY